MATSRRKKFLKSKRPEFLIDNITSFKCQQTTNNFIISLRFSAFEAWIPGSRNPMRGPLSFSSHFVPDSLK